MTIMPKKNDTSPPDVKCCDSPDILFKSGKYTCVNCGFVRGTRLVNRSNRCYSKTEEDQRKHTEIVSIEYGPRTVFGNKKDAYGKNISSKHKFLYYRLKKQHGTYFNSTERNHSKAYQILKNVKTEFNIPYFISTTAFHIYKISRMKKMIKGRSIKAFVAASIYVSVRIYDRAIFINEFAEYFNLTTKNMHRAISLIVRDILPDLSIDYEPISVPDAIYRIIAKLKLRPKTNKICYNLYVRLRKEGFRNIGKDPRGIAGGIIYIADRLYNIGNGSRITQSRISKEAMICEATVRNRLKEMKKYLMDRT